MKSDEFASQPWVAIQRNPKSGSGPRRRILRELINRLREHGIRPRLFSRRDLLTARVRCETRSKSLRCIVAAGGDGTAADVANRFPHLPVAVLPLGTENLLARYLGIPRSGKFVADIIAAGHTKTLDTGMLNGRRFLLMAGLGFDADVVHRLDARRTGHIRRISYVPRICEAVRNYRHPEMKFYLDGSESPLVATAGFIVNLPEYGFRLPIANSANGTDGLLDLRLFTPRNTRQFLKKAFQIWRGKHEQSPDVVSARASHIRIEAETEIPIQVDGDPCGLTPAEITVEPGSFTVICPRE